MTPGEGVLILSCDPTSHEGISNMHFFLNLYLFTLAHKSYKLVGIIEDQGRIYQIRDFHDPRARGMLGCGHINLENNLFFQIHLLYFFYFFAQHRLTKSIRERLPKL